MDTNISKEVIMVTNTKNKDNKFRALCQKSYNLMQIPDNLPKLTKEPRPCEVSKT